MPDQAWYRQIHKRLLSGDPVAPAEVAEAMLNPLIRKLGQVHPNLRGSHILTEAIIETLMSYIKNPKQFNPTKRSLFGFLVMAAEGDLLNALAKLKRRKEKEKEIIQKLVELPEDIGKEELEDKDFLGSLDARGIRNEIRGLFNNSRDRQMAELILDGKRSFEPFAKILRIKKLSIDEQRREVKRHKDRIRKRLERYAETIRQKYQ